MNAKSVWKLALEYFAAREKFPGALVTELKLETDKVQRGTPSGTDSGYWGDHGNIVGNDGGNVTDMGFWGLQCYGVIMRT